MPVPFIDIKRFEPDFLLAWQAKVAEMSAQAQFVGGPEVARLEQRLAAATGVDHAISCGNGTDAIQLALRAVDVGPGDVVLLPNATFWATFEAVVNVGASPVTVDINPADGALDLDAFTQALNTHAPKAALVVHLYGWGSARLAELRQLCQARGVVLVEDGAQSFGVTYQEQSIYAGAAIATTSFYPAKVLGAAGDGGAVFTSHAGWAEKARQLGNHGRTSHYGYGLVGWNSRMDALQAAFVNLALDHFDARLASRREAAAYYRSKLPALGVSVMPAPADYNENGYCNVCVLPDPAQKAAVEAALKDAGIGFANIYPGAMSEQEGARGVLHAHVGGDCAQTLCASVLNLPLFAYITRAEQDEVMVVLQQAMAATPA